MKKKKKNKMKRKKKLETLKNWEEEEEEEEAEEKPDRRKTKRPFATMLVTRQGFPSCEGSHSQPYLSVGWFGGSHTSQ